MEYEVDITIKGREHNNITVCADGEVDITAQIGYEDVTVSFDISELEEMLKQAKAHKSKYDAYIANNYVDIAMPEIGVMAKPNWGRNANTWGKIVEVNPNQSGVLIDFGGTVTTPDGFKMKDQYWSSLELIELKDAT